MADKDKPVKNEQTPEQPPAAPPDEPKAPDTPVENSAPTTPPGEPKAPEVPAENSAPAPSPEAPPRPRIDPEPPAEQRAQEKRYWMVNPAGAVHEVDREHAAMRLRQGGGWRKATQAEIRQYLSTRIQRWDKPIAPRWQPDPDDEPEV